MRGTFSVILAVAVAAGLIVGCGSDSDEKKTDNGGSQCVGGYAKLTSSEFRSQAADGACADTENATSVCGNDLPIIVGGCGKACLGMGDDAEQASCVAECTNDGLASGFKPLSSACVACYTADVECARKHCLLKCGLDPASDECAVCRDTNACTSTFYECSGLPRPGGSNGEAGAEGT